MVNLGKGKLRLHWEGSQRIRHSLAFVNREICTRLMDNPNFDLGIIPYESDPNFPLDEGLVQIQSRIASDDSQADITVRHQWPPKWSVPKTGKWVIFQPWEYGAIPRQWYIPMKHWVNEIWVYSTYNKACYVQSGIPENKIHVIPLGVDTSVFHPGVSDIQLNTKKSFKFLFVGGTIYRKGIDTLLKAYAEEFTADDDVCLIVKDFGVDSVYEGMTSERLIQEFGNRPNSPEIVYITSDMSAGQLAQLYKTCHCLVHPYRGEGFGLPILEAMACGTPAIVPNLGSARDFCSEQTAFLVPAEEQTYPIDKIGPYELVSDPWWIKTDPHELQKAMRFAYENRQAVQEKGELAAEYVTSNYTWAHTVSAVADRLDAILADEHPSRRRPDDEIILDEMQQGLSQYQSGAFQLAFGTFMCVLETYPGNVHARYNAGVMSVLGRNFEVALGHFRHLANRMADQPNSFQGQVWSYIGLCYTQLHDLVPAMVALERGTRLSSDTLVGAIRCYHQLLQMVDESDKSQSIRGEIYYRLGVAHFALGNDLRALEMAKSALQLNSSRADVKHSYELIQHKISLTKDQYRGLTSGTSGDFQIPVIWQAPIFNATGYAQETRSFLRALEQFPVDVQLAAIDAQPNVELTGTDEERHFIHLMRNAVRNPIIHVQSCPASQLTVPRAPISVGRTMFETDALPPQWLERMDALTDVWVPSHFNRDTFIRAGMDPSRVFVVPDTLDFTKFNPDNVKPYPLHHKKAFSFLSMFDWNRRKGWDVLLRAYFSEFRSSDDVCLVLKVTHLLEPDSRPTEDVKTLARKMGIQNPPAVVVIDASLSESEIVQLYAAADAFVLPSRGEGWGRPYMEAMAMQLPTIGTRWGGQLDFMDDTNSYLINVDDVVPVDPTIAYFGKLSGHKWAEPSQSHLQCLMREVFERSDDARKTGINARQSLLSSFSNEQIGSCIYGRMIELIQRCYA